MTTLDAAKLAWLSFHAQLALGGAAPDVGQRANASAYLRVAVDLLSTPDRYAFTAWADTMTERLLVVLRDGAAEIRGNSN